MVPSKSTAAPSTRRMTLLFIRAPVSRPERSTRPDAFHAYSCDLLYVDSVACCDAQPEPEVQRTIGETIKISVAVKPRNEKRFRPITRRTGRPGEGLV